MVTAVFLFKSCVRCKGTLAPDEDMWAVYTQCVNCGQEEQVQRKKRGPFWEDIGRIMVMPPFRILYEPVQITDQESDDWAATLSELKEAGVGTDAGEHLQAVARVNDDLYGKRGDFWEKLNIDAPKTIVVEPKPPTATHTPIASPKEMTCLIRGCLNKVNGVSLCPEHWENRRSLKPEWQRDGGRRVHSYNMKVGGVNAGRKR